MTLAFSPPPALHRPTFIQYSSMAKFKTKSQKNANLTVIFITAELAVDAAVAAQ